MTDFLFGLTVLAIIIFLIIFGFAMGKTATESIEPIPAGWALVDVQGDIDWLLDSAPAGTEVKLGAGTYTTKGITCSDKGEVRFNITGATTIRGSGKDKTFLNGLEG